jgi:hypothetical protein
VTICASSDLLSAATTATVVHKSGHVTARFFKNVESDRVEFLLAK